MDAPFVMIAEPSVDEQWLHQEVVKLKHKAIRTKVATHALQRAYERLKRQHKRLQHREQTLKAVLSTIGANETLFPQSMCRDTLAYLYPKDRR